MGPDGAEPSGEVTAPTEVSAVAPNSPTPGIKPSVGSVGDRYDNALAETGVGLFKTEVIRRRGPWRTLETVAFAILEWVNRFNNLRLLEPIGNIPPAVAELCFYTQSRELSMVP